MSITDELTDLIKEYRYPIIWRVPERFFIKGEIPKKKIEKAKKHYASGIDEQSIIALYDNTLTGNGHGGYIFTDTKVVYRDINKGKIWYDDIESVEVYSSGKKSRGLKFNLKDEPAVCWTTCDFLMDKLCEFFTKLIGIVNKTIPDSSHSSGVGRQSEDFSGAIAGGYAAAAHGEVNKLYEEEKFHARQGHGYAAERANTLYDKMTGHDAKIVGDDNAKNGADRIVDGVQIQSKYCRTGKACIDECFDKKGDFRYLNDGKPMQIEVPSDKYEAAIEAMQEKIQNGKVPGVTDPEEAKNIVRKGHFTYEQAKNIAKAGTVESIAYDAVNGIVYGTTAFGVTAAITLATNLWNGEDFNKALKSAAFSGLKVGGTAFATTIIASQLSKAGLNSALVGSSEAIVAFMGPKASAILVNAFRHGSNIYGAAAMKSAAKLLRGNAITAAVTVVVLSSFDVGNIFRGRISGKQLFKNLTNTATTVAGGTGGWMGGAAVGTAILPGVGTVIGGLIGSITAGAIAGKATDAILDNFIEDDADEMLDIIQEVFTELAGEYLLNQKEGEKAVDALSKDLDGKKLKDMFASKDRKKFAKDMLVPYIENEVKKRKHIEALTDDQMVAGLREVFEDIADSVEEEEIA